MNRPTDYHHSDRDPYGSFRCVCNVHGCDTGFRWRAKSDRLMNGTGKARFRKLAKTLRLVALRTLDVRLMFIFRAIYNAGIWSLNDLNYTAHLETQRFCETYTPYDFSKDAKYWRKAD